MCCSRRAFGFSALAFGAGVLLCTVLPPLAMACVEAGVIVGVGVILFAK
ncbi:MAG: hypothetical protein IKK06_06525 [Clostridia bacterium]|nr:hypothetical protein [Clostridia bacterium]MBR4054443.1 hypothetical protein [Clostridia bacterium]